MTKIIYSVIDRPKKDSTGRTNVGWLAECGRPEVSYGGHLITQRTVKGQDRSYLAVVSKDNLERTLADTFTSRAQASFAIWRAYHEDWRNARSMDRDHGEAIRENKRRQRAAVRAFRKTDDGKEAYRLELNSKARARRANMTPDEKALVVTKRISARLRKTIADI